MNFRLRLTATYKNAMANRYPKELIVVVKLNDERIEKEECKGHARGA